MGNKKNVGEKKGKSKMWEKYRKNTGKSKMRKIKIDDPVGIQFVNPGLALPKQCQDYLSQKKCKENPVLDSRQLDLG